MPHTIFLGSIDMLTFALAVYVRHHRLACKDQQSTDRTLSSWILTYPAFRQEFHVQFKGPSDSKSILHFRRWVKRRPSSTGLPDLILVSQLRMPMAYGKFGSRYQMTTRTRARVSALPTGYTTRTSMSCKLGTVMIISPDPRPTATQSLFFCQIRFRLLGRHQPNMVANV